MGKNLFFQEENAYLKKNYLSKKKKNNYFSLLFEGVYRNAKVILNDKVVGTNKYGYSEFSIDVTNDIKEGKNILEVEVDNSLYGVYVVPITALKKFELIELFQNLMSLNVRTLRI